MSKCNLYSLCLHGLFYVITFPVLECCWVALRVLQNGNNELQQKERSIYFDTEKNCITGVSN